MASTKSNHSLPEATAVPATRVLSAIEDVPNDEPYRDARDLESCLFKGLFCFYQACTPNCGFRAQSECLCLRKTVCLECCGDTAPRGVGIVTENSDEICKIGCYCCDYALIQPRVLTGMASHVLCLRQVGSIPFHEDYVEQPVCAYYCVSCLPQCGIAVAPPQCPALDHKMKVSRSGGGGQVVYQVESMDRGCVPMAEAEYVSVSSSEDEGEII